MDVLAELSYVSMTPDHFPSMFCKVRDEDRLLVLKSKNNDGHNGFLIVVVVEVALLHGASLAVIT